MEKFDINDYFGYLLLNSENENFTDKRIWNIFSFYNIFIFLLIFFGVAIIVTIFFKNFIINYCFVIFSMLFSVTFFRNFKSKRTLSILIFSFLSQFLDILTTMLASFIKYKSLLNISFIEANPFMRLFVEINPINGTILSIFNKFAIGLLLSMPLILNDYLNTNFISLYKDNTIEEFPSIKNFTLFSAYGLINKFYEFNLALLFSYIKNIFSKNLTIKTEKIERRIKLNYVAYKRNFIIIKFCWDFISIFSFFLILLFYVVVLNNIILLFKVIRNPSNLTFRTLKSSEDIISYLCVTLLAIIIIENFSILLSFCKFKRNLRKKEERE